jgi:DNA-binding protein H-NS
MAKSPNVELESMNDAQIRELIEHAREVIGERFSSRVDEWRTLAHEAGYELTVTKLGESDGQRRRRRSADAGETGDRRRKVEPKYRNPDNHAETWTGRGREPKWMEQKIAEGGKKEDFLIKPAQAEALEETA